MLDEATVADGLLYLCRRQPLWFRRAGRLLSALPEKLVLPVTARAAADPVLLRLAGEDVPLEHVHANRARAENLS